MSFDRLECKGQSTIHRGFTILNKLLSLFDITDQKKVVYTPKLWYLTVCDDMGLMPTPKDAHSLIPRTWEYVTPREKNSAAVIRLNFGGYNEYFCIFE